MENVEKGIDEIITQLIGYYGDDPIYTYDKEEEKEAFTILNNLYSYYKQFADGGVFSSLNIKKDIEKNIQHTVSIDENFRKVFENIINKYTKYDKQEYKYFLEILLNQCKCQKHIRENALWDEQSLRTSGLNYTAKGLRCLGGYPFYPVDRPSYWEDIQQERRKLAPFVIGLLPKKEDYDEKHYELRQLVEKREDLLREQKKKLEAQGEIGEIDYYTPTDYEKECLILYVRFAIMLLWIDYRLKQLNENNNKFEEKLEPIIYYLSYQDQIKKKFAELFPTGPKEDNKHKHLDDKIDKIIEKLLKNKNCNFSFLYKTYKNQLNLFKQKKVNLTAVLTDDEEFKSVYHLIREVTEYGQDNNYKKQEIEYFTIELLTKCKERAKWLAEKNRAIIEKTEKAINNNIFLTIKGECLVQLCFVYSVRFYLVSEQLRCPFYFLLEDSYHSIIQQDPPQPQPEQSTQVATHQKNPLINSIHNFLEKSFGDIMKFLSRKYTDKNITIGKILEESEDTNYEYIWKASLRNFVYFVALINGKESTKIGSFLKNPQDRINWRIFLNSIEVRDENGTVINDGGRCSQKYKDATFPNFDNFDETLLSGLSEDNKICYRIYKLVCDHYTQQPK